MRWILGLLVAALVWVATPAQAQFVSLITCSATGTTAAVTCTLNSVAGKITYICGFSIGSTATAAINGTATIANTVNGTMNFLQGVGATPAIQTLSQTFSPCIPANAVNTFLQVTTVAAGTAGVTDVSAWGFQQ